MPACSDDAITKLLAIEVTKLRDAVHGREPNVAAACSTATLHDQQPDLPQERDRALYCGPAEAGFPRESFFRDTQNDASWSIVRVPVQAQIDEPMRRPEGAGKVPVEHSVGCLEVTFGCSRRNHHRMMFRTIVSRLHQNLRDLLPVVRSKGLPAATPSPVFADRSVG